MEKESNTFPHWTLGRYILIKTLGKGGMGEVFLAFDPLCCRYLALKKIRNELLDKPNIHERFLKEARIASQLTHPSIITIFSIHSDPSLTYYTMPYVEGRTLKEILQTSKEKTKKNELLPPDESLFSLLRIFRKLCEAIAYTHSRGILHRDLKPDNVIVGKFGEVLLLDWGIATSINGKEKEEEVEEVSKEPLTKPGKIAGTVTYLAPERAFGATSSIQTDIYALGVMLYQILTLTSPFRRTTLAELRKNAKSEKVIDPRERAPNRDIPPQLADIAMKALASSLEERYQKVDDLLVDLQKYFEGDSSWIYHTHLQLQNKEDWQLHENILLAKHTALTKQPEHAEWASLQVSKASFLGNIKIEAEIILKKEGKGIGFLLDIPKKESRSHVAEGYCLWCGSAKDKNSFLLRSQIAVKEIPKLSLSSQTKHHLCIERIHNQIRIFFDGTLITTYASLLPLSGTHVGVLYKDTDFILKSLRISSGRQPLFINCLAIPDAFFIKGHWEIALQEYRQIALSFTGRAEAREATFRAGLSLLELAKKTRKQKKKEQLFQEALEEFEPLHSTVGAPLEYLGKSIAYAAMKESEEEAKCLELSLRKFVNHPSLPILQEQLIFRSLESSAKERKTAYRLILIGVQHIPQFLEMRETKKLLESLQNYWEWPIFQETSSALLPKKELLTIYLAFHLARKETLCELVEKALLEPGQEEILEEALFALLELGEIKTVSSYLSSLLSHFPHYDWSYLSLLLAWHSSSKKDPFFFFKKIGKERRALRPLLHIVQDCLVLQKNAPLTPFFEEIKPLFSQHSLLLDSFYLWHLLLEKKFQKASEIFQKYSSASFNDEKNPLHFLYYIWLAATEGEKVSRNHFSSLLETLYPHSSSLLSHFLLKKISLKKWDKDAFFWEKRALFRQLSLFYHCTENKKLATHYRKLSFASFQSS